MGLIKNKNIEPASQAPQSLSCAEWLQQLTDVMPEQRRRAAFALVHCKQAVSALSAQLNKETDLSVQDAIFNTLGQIGNDEAVQALIPLLRSEDALLRNKTTEVLQQLPEPLAPYITDLLMDEDADVRILTINVLANLKHPDTPKWLQQIIERDTHINVCATAVDLLAELGTLATIPALEDLVHRFPDEPFIDFAVATAIKRIQGHNH